MRRKLFFAVLFASAALSLPAQQLTLPLAALGAGARPPAAGGEARLSPVEDVQRHKLWELGPFVQGGVGVGDRSDYSFFSLGFEAGKLISRPLRAGILSGQFEYAGNILPFWQAYTPPAGLREAQIAGTDTRELVPHGGGTFTGVSITPILLRWNFTSHHRVLPWVQGGGGLIYTTHKFPPDFEVPKGTPGGTSVFNFTPQGGAGLHYFLAARRSLDFSVNAVHISSASLGDRNPGVNASLQFQLGYTWWK